MDGNAYLMSWMLEAYNLDLYKAHSPNFALSHTGDYRLGSLDKVGTIYPLGTLGNALNALFFIIKWPLLRTKGEMLQFGSEVSCKGPCVKSLITSLSCH